MTFGIEMQTWGAAAPARLSTTTFCPRRSASLGAMSRDMMSIVLPGGNATMMRLMYVFAIYNKPRRDRFT